MDVKTVFLNGELDEEIYMDQPEAFITLGKENKVCKLVKSLYGLKQAPKQWHKKFDSVIFSNGFVINDADKCVYVKLLENACVILYLYVGDILIFGTNLNVINERKNFLSKKFDMKDLGVANVILDVKLIKHDVGIILTQSNYVESLLKKFNFYNVKQVSTPFDPHLRLKWWSITTFILSNYWFFYVSV